MTARRVGLLGGTFDPIHLGHIDAGRAAGEALELTRVFVLTANIPPHRPQPRASGYHRFAMTAMAVSGIDRWHASDLELRSGAQSFTTGTLRQFHEQGYAASELFFILGADAFLEIASWKDYPGILDDAHFAVVSRPGVSVQTLPARLSALAERMARPPVQSVSPPLIWLIDAPTSDVSSTAIRDRRGAGLSIAGMVPPAVEQHIEQHGLYAMEDADRHEPSAPDRRP